MSPVFSPPKPQPKAETATWVSALKIAERCKIGRVRLLTLATRGAVRYRTSARHQSYVEYCLEDALLVARTERLIAD
jgi:hypothetical protein